MRKKRPQKTQASKTSAPPAITDEEMRQAWPGFLVLLYSHQLEIYREMEDLLRKAKVRGCRETFEEFAEKSPNRDSLLDGIPDREAVLRRQVDEHMRECSKRGLATPRVLLDFNRELWPTDKNESTLQRERELADIRERFVDLLDEGFGTKRLVKLLGVSTTTIKKWRKPDQLQEIYESVENDVAAIRRLAGKDRK